MTVIYIPASDLSGVRHSAKQARVDKHPQKGTFCDRVVLKAQHLVLSCEDLQAHAANCKPIPRIKSKDSLTLITDAICRVFLGKSLTNDHPFKKNSRAPSSLTVKVA